MGVGLQQVVNLREAGGNSPKNEAWKLHPIAPYLCNIWASETEERSCSNTLLLSQSGIWTSVASSRTVRGINEEYSQQYVALTFFSEFARTKVIVWQHAKLSSSETCAEQQSRRHFKEVHLSVWEEMRADQQWYLNGVIRHHGITWWFQIC